MYLSKDDILSCQDIQTEEVEAFGGKILVKTLTGSERDQFEERLYNQKTDLQNVRATLVAMSVVDENLEPLFTLDDVEALGKKSAANLQKVFEVAQRLSRLGKDDVEELAKN